MRLSILLKSRKYNFKTKKKKIKKRISIFSKTKKLEKIYLIIIFLLFYIYYFLKNKNQFIIGPQRKNNFYPIKNNLYPIKNNSFPKTNSSFPKTNNSLTKTNSSLPKTNISLPIKLYWFGYGDCPNAGDYFGKWLLEKFGYTVNYSKTPDILVCGSVIGYPDINITNSKIWGAGYHYEKEGEKMIKPEQIYAVRGALTLKKLNFSSNFNSKIVLGDPGLLLSVFFKPNTSKSYNICIVSHYIDYSFFSRKYANEYYVINMGTNNIENLANSINKCNFVFSSSLHGIIFSHSLGIPAVHLEYQMLGSYKNFKFKDYYSTLDIPYVKENLNIDKLEDIIRKYDKNRNEFLPKRNIIEKIQNDLLKNFPYKNLENYMHM